MTTEAIVTLIASIVNLIILAIIVGSLVGIKKNTNGIEDELFISNMLNISQTYLDNLTERERIVIHAFTDVTKTLRVKEIGATEGEIGSLHDKNIIEYTSDNGYAPQGFAFYQLTIFGKHVWYALSLVNTKGN